ncbi:MAG: 6-phosphofructokinase [Anaerolineae bacterium]|jgi:6-phosphofructokinase|nr:6-phosphofructokinase [Chloroflexota bacterium]
MASRPNLVVGQSGGPTAVINNSLVGVIHQALEENAIGGIYGMLHGIAGVLNEEFVDLRQESAETLERLRNTPASALGTVRRKLKPEDYDKLVDVFVKYDIGYFLYIGGNDSMDTVYQVSRMAERRGVDLRVIGLPKTIDNDLAMTDHCPGFGSAARFVASAVRNSGLDTRSMGPDGPIKLVEIMGRNAGWLAAAAALAKEDESDPPHLIYLPERPVSREQIVDDVKATLDRYGYCVASVSEGIVDENGEAYAMPSGKVDAFGHEVKLGVIETVASVVEEAVRIRPRFDKPAYMQRSFAEMQSQVDREEAYQSGREGVRAAVAGASGKMIAFERLAGPEYAIAYRLQDLDQIANAEHVVPTEYINAAGNGVTQAFLDYARPLIGGPLAAYGKLAARAIPRR